MVVANGINELGDDFRGAVVTLGVYDGLHNAHMAIINRVIASAAERKTHSLMITFHPHPRNVLSRAASPVKLLTTPSEKVTLLKDTALDGILFLNVDHDLLNTASEEFVESVLVDRLNVYKVIVGYDYHFGRDRGGKAKQLISYGEKYGFEVDIIGKILIGNEPVSSSAVRSQLSAGNVEKAAKFLGRHYSIKGRVVHGSGRGRALSFPTANIVPDKTSKMIPVDGIYLTECEVSGLRSFGICNIGIRKTFNETDRVIEVYLIDVTDVDLYDQVFKIKFLERLRDEIKFATSKELVDQMIKDEKDCRVRTKKYNYEMED